MASESDIKVQMLKDDDLADNDDDGGYLMRKRQEYTSTGSLIFDVTYSDDGQGSISTNPVGPDGQKTKGRNLFFDDTVSRIDFVLAWEVPKKEDEKTEKARRARELFEKNLRAEGLKLEQDLDDEEVHYCKVHAPWEVLTRYAEILKMKLPMKETLVAQKIKKKYSKWEETVDMNLLSKNPADLTVYERVMVTLNPVKAISSSLWNTIRRLVDTVKHPFQLDKNVMPKISKQPTLVYTRDREYLFDIPEQKELFFTNAERSRIVDFILRRKSFGEDNSEAYTFEGHEHHLKVKGIRKMLSDGYYDAAYPLHEGHWKKTSANNARKTLYDNWGYWKRFFKEQPVEYIKKYYGSKIALYFAWLGYYTEMLVPPAIIGLFIFIYGTVYMKDSYPSKEICDESLNITMCPLCDYQCPYWKLSDACNDAKYSRMFDNNGTVFFAVFMSLWGTLFLEFWKRKAAVLQYKWDLVEFVKEEEPPRPEYLAKLANYPLQKVNPITGMQEPHLPFWRRRFPIFVLSYGIMLFTMCLAIAAVVGVIAYRVSTLAALQLLEGDKIQPNTTVDVTKHLLTANASLITTITGACINLIIIIILNIVYARVVVWLTDFECLRTQTEYDDSINIKLYTLQFVNYYASIFYIAFFKGRLIGPPNNYNKAFGARQEECGSGGCLIELCIQLAIIMAGKQFIQNNLLEIVMPKTIKWLKRCYRRKFLKETAEQKAKMKAWEKDYQLSAHESLYHEYLEMVLQFGFLTIFVAAFPLGPLCCLLNNIIEIRSDAMKFTTDLRRPLAEQAPDIGIWYSILYAISRVAIVSNAFIIALTSDFIPRLVYWYYYSDGKTMSGYTQFTLSYFNTTDFPPDIPRDPFNQHVDVCRYKDFRNPPGVDEYEYSEAYWHVMAARLAFVVVFENLVVVFTSLIAWLIPDVPADVKNQIRRQAYISNEIVIKTELVKARGESIGDKIIGDIIVGELFKPKHKGASNGSELRHRVAVDQEDDPNDTKVTMVDDVSVSNI